MTLGKWAWKLPPFKQSVTTDLTNLKVLKMDNAQVGDKAEVILNLKYRKKKRVL